MLHLGWDLVWTLLNILILYLLMRKFLFKPVASHMEKRKQAIEDSIKRAETVNEEAAQLKEKYRAAVADAHVQADDILKTARKQASDERDAEVAKAKLEAAQLRADADRTIEAQRTRAVAEIQNEIAGLAVSAARRVLESSVDDSVDSRMLDKFLAEEGVTE
ncbi:MAG: F0F1 ATP synthase subunit B [Oscillospiraceae bacterium]